MGVMRGDGALVVRRPDVERSRERQYWWSRGMQEWNGLRRYPGHGGEGVKRFAGGWWLQSFSRRLVPC